MFIYHSVKETLAFPLVSNFLAVSDVLGPVYLSCLDYLGDEACPETRAVEGEG